MHTGNHKVLRVVRKPFGARKLFLWRGWFSLMVLFIAPSVLSQVSVDHYSLPFGNQPFAPSRASSQVPGFLKASDFAPAQFCGKCHIEIHREWRESAHSNSFREPFYLKNVEMLIKQKGIEYTRHCEGCHNPVALLSGTLTPNSTAPRPFDNEGITCEVCHSIAKIEQNGGTGSYVMGQPAVMLNPDGTPRPGIPTYSEIFENVALHKKAVMKDFLKTPEFCSVCHKAAIPKELDGYKWLRAFSVYDEWQQSSWSKQSPLPFYQKEVASGCQACHMPFRPGKSEYGAIEGKIHSHRFVGANSAIPAFYSYADQLAKTQQFLKDALAVDIFGLTIRHKNSTKEIYPLKSKSFKIRAGDELTVDVVIQNTRAGHSLVPEQRDFYQSWVECIVKDERGKLVFHSGGLNGDGFLDPYAHSYTNRLIDRQGRRIDHHEVWQTRLKTYDNTILPGRSDLVRFRFRVPDGRIRSLDIVVRVN
ncbi:MAG TPA: multiheme c-type cytochrome, partial [Nitrospira sp.]|nr:multiheme c-type cytochrome [Nitrospira sp.]